jgi:glutathione S-transferase
VPPALTVYSRNSCHLCEEMIAALHSLQGRFRFEIVVVDVDVDPDLRQRYGERVPVLAHGERELCQHRIDQLAVTEYLAKTC